MLRPGETIRGCTVTGLLGEGGMGAVYAAVRETDGTEVAVKVLHQARGENLVRARNEAMMLGTPDSWPDPEALGAPPEIGAALRRALDPDPPAGQGHAVDPTRPADRSALATARAAHADVWLHRNELAMARFDATGDPADAVRSAGEALERTADQALRIRAWVVRAGDPAHDPNGSELPLAIQRARALADPKLEGDAWLALASRLLRKGDQGKAEASGEEALSARRARAEHLLAMSERNLAVSEVLRGAAGRAIEPLAVEDRSWDVRLTRNMARVVLGRTE